MRTSLASLALALALAACESGPPQPAPLDTRNEQCAGCRMAVSQAVFASQLVAPGEAAALLRRPGLPGRLPRRGGQVPPGAIAFVADHRTREWVRADRAVYTRVPGLETPMGSHVIAHADAASRAQDPLAQGGSPVSATELFGPSGPPAGGGR